VQVAAPEVASEKPHLAPEPEPEAEKPVEKPTSSALAEEVILMILVAATLWLIYINDL
jgi:hypothetical protein